MWENLRPIYARKLFDISWRAILHAVSGLFIRRPTAEQMVAALEDLWAPQQTLVALTVRSGFDLCLQACAFPPGSEIIVSAVTIPDMVRIIAHHRLVPVPVDIQNDGSVFAEDVAGLMTTKTKAILIAQLFGARKPLEAVADVARKRGVLVIEDCAQAFCGSQFVGSEGADISMFSFGPIKTCTVLGGALLTIRIPTLLHKMQSIQAHYPRQPSSRFLRRVGKYAVLKALSDSVYAYGLVIAVLCLLGKDHHSFVTRLSHSLTPDNIWTQIRQRPAVALLQLLHYRLAHFETKDLERRQARVARLADLLPADLQPVGFAEQQHHFWLCPVRVDRPGVLIDSLFRAGFDVADGGTSLTVVSTGAQDQTRCSAQMMREIVYVPIDHSFNDRDLNRLADVFRHHRKT